jgi:NAD(P)-dependent dehydrogenase (short-subunit alcohol dehydrogenase family)
MKKNVLITGASGNLGKAAVEKFIAEGYHVIAIVSPGKASGFAKVPDSTVYEADLADEAATQEIVSKIVIDHQTIDAALLLVGGFASGTIHTTDGTALKKMFSVNFDTAYFMTRPIFKQMITQTSGGRIILVGSRPALKPADGKRSLGYALSKSLIFSLADMLNAEGSDKNVVSSVIVPSTIDTPENRTAMPQADFSSWVKPEEIAEAMAFLASEKSKALREPVVKMYGRA